MRVLGVDPGGRASGLVVRHGRTLCGWTLVVRDDDLTAYLRAVTTAVDQLLHDHACDVLAVETLTDPNPHLGLTNVRGLIDTAHVLGALLHHFDDVRLVRPGGHGKTPGLPRGRVLDAYMRDAYPAELLPDRDGVAYEDAKRHLRSAWDVAAAGLNVQQRFGVTA